MKRGMKRLLIGGYCRGLIPAAVVTWAFRVWGLEKE